MSLFLMLYTLHFSRFPLLPTFASRPQNQVVIVQTLRLSSTLKEYAAWNEESLFYKMCCSTIEADRSLSVSGVPKFSGCLYRRTSRAEVDCFTPSIAPVALTPSMTLDEILHSLSKEDRKRVKRMTSRVATLGERPAWNISWVWDECVCFCRGM